MTNCATAFAVFSIHAEPDLRVVAARDPGRISRALRPWPWGDLFQVCDQQGQWLYRSVPLENNNVAIALPASIPQPTYEDIQVGRHWLSFYSRRIAVNGNAYTVQVASLMNEAYEALERFRLILLLAKPLVWCNQNS